MTLQIPRMDTEEKDGLGKSEARRIQPEIDRVIERRFVTGENNLRYGGASKPSSPAARRGIRERARRRRDWQIPVDRNRDCVSNSVLRNAADINKKIATIVSNVNR